MTSDNEMTEQEPDVGVNVVVTWLKEKGFGEAARHLAQASKEVAERISEAKDVEWLYYQHELKKATQSSGDEDELPWEQF